MLQIKVMEWGIEHHASSYFVLTQTLGPWVGQKVKTSFIIWK